MQYCVELAGAHTEPGAELRWGDQSGELVAGEVSPPLVIAHPIADGDFLASFRERSNQIRANEAGATRHQIHVFTGLARLEANMFMRFIV
jgi:hypothetical protein